MVPRKPVWRMLGGLTALALLGACAPAASPTPGPAVEAQPGAAPKVVTVYSSRIEALIKPAFDAFTQETGIQVRFTTASEAELLERLKAEGPNTPADLLITVDAGNLWLAAQEGLLQPVTSPVLEQNVPPHLRDPQNRWFALTVRARPIMYSTERVDPQELSTYEALADPRWKGRLCLRTSAKVYTQSLIASLVAHLGEQKAEQVVRGWMANEPRIFNSDTKMLEAIAAGECDVTVANTYYLGRLLKKDPDFPVAVFWPNQEDRGTHINISGAGVTAYAPNRENAIKLLEWLTTPRAQRLFADANLEYPVNPEVEPHPILARWGEFKADTLNVAELGRLQAVAVKIADRAGYP